MLPVSNQAAALCLSVPHPETGGCLGFQPKYVRFDSAGKGWWNAVGRRCWTLFFSFPLTTHWGDAVLCVVMLVRLSRFTMQTRRHGSVYHPSFVISITYGEAKVFPYRWFNWCWRLLWLFRSPVCHAATLHSFCFRVKVPRSRDCTTFLPSAFTQLIIPF